MVTRAAKAAASAAADVSAVETESGTLCLLIFIAQFWGHVIPVMKMISTYMATAETKYLFAASEFTTSPTTSFFDRLNNARNSGV